MAAIAEGKEEPSDDDADYNYIQSKSMSKSYFNPTEV